MEEEITPAVVACGVEHTASITRRGQLLTWGLGNRGELGHNLQHALPLTQYNALAEHKEQLPKSNKLKNWDQASLHRPPNINLYNAVTPMHYQLVMLSSNHKPLLGS